LGLLGIQYQRNYNVKTFLKKPEILSGLCDMIITDQLNRGGFGWMPEIKKKDVTACHIHFRQT